MLKHDLQEVNKNYSELVQVADEVRKEVDSATKRVQQITKEGPHTRWPCCVGRSCWENLI